MFADSGSCGSCTSRPVDSTCIWQTRSLNQAVLGVRCELESWSCRTVGAARRVSGQVHQVHIARCTSELRHKALLELYCVNVTSIYRGMCYIRHVEVDYLSRRPNVRPKFYFLIWYTSTIRHWTCCYITITNSRVFRLQLLGTH
jgi:hypothetical protein